MKAQKSKKGTWTVNMGFLTGSPEQKNQSWFNIERTYSNCTFRQAVAATKRSAYSTNNDICADLIFWYKDTEGNLFSE